MTPDVARRRFLSEITCEWVSKKGDFVSALRAVAAGGDSVHMGAGPPMLPISCIQASPGVLVPIV